LNTNNKGPSIKGVSSQEGGVVCPVRHFSDKERGRFFSCGRPYFLVQKLRIFWNLCCVRTDKGGGDWASADLGKDNFCDFVWTSFMDGP